MALNIRTVRYAGFITTVAALAMAIGQQQAQAGQLSSGWTYSYDAIGDGSGENLTDTKYDIRGTAMSVQNDKLIIALTGGMPITGNSYGGAADGNVGWGDLFFNFTGKKFNDAEGQLFGVRFAATNDSPVSTGVYSNVKTTSLTSVNSGYSSLNHYYTAENGRYNKQNTQGSALVTAADAESYYGASGPIQTSINSGTKVGEISQFFNANELGALGLNFGSATGSQTFGFSFDRALLPSGSFLANLFLECGNDGVAIAATVPEPTSPDTSKKVPEPSTLGAILLTSLVSLRYGKKRKQSALGLVPVK
jgi:hypothetical protein